MVKKKNIVLIGLGPHAKRIYLNYFRKHKSNLELVVELNCTYKETRQYLNENGFKNTKIFCIDRKYKDNNHLPKKIADNLLAICETLEITHIIISTEPKAHNMYLEFALKNNIDVLTDKPITVTKNMTSMRSISQVRKQYYNILNLANNSKAKCNVMCQRQYHKGYDYVKKIISDVVKKHQIPITYIDIYHCDGNWEMPHDLLKENHPYKFGYGKLFHSGYHFIDLLSEFIKINDQLTGNKKITKGEVYSNCFTPNDELAILNIDDYKRIFKKQNIPDYYFENSNPKFNKFGEKNFYGLLKFTNKHDQTITTANLNLLHYGFSRRGWIESKDYYKKNGRIRHERINIQIGPLMNIQIHSYQSKQICDRLDNELEEQVGGLEHFDIDIYRNVDIIGGKAFERIKLGDLYTDQEKESFLGYNELSREVYLTKFLNGKSKKGNIKDQALGIEILYSCALGIKNHYEHNEKVQKINIKAKYNAPVKLKDLEKYVKIENKTNNKTNLNHYVVDSDDYDFGVIMNYLIDDEKYEIYFYVEDGKKIVSPLFYKTFKSNVLATTYYLLLSQLANRKDIKKVAKWLNRISQ